MKIMKRIVVLGAGFGGLRTTLVLGRWKKKTKSPHEIILIDRNNYHIYTPTLYEISTTSKEIANYLELKSIVTFPLEMVLNRLPVNFIQAEIKNIDPQKKIIVLANNKISYDYLVIALGSETNFFNLPGLKEKALELKNFNDAVKIRDAIWEKVESSSPTDFIRIVIGGGGSTGVELAGEIQEWLAQLRGEGYRCRTSVVLIDGGPTILSNFDKKIIAKATRRLEKLGVNLLTNETVAKVEDNRVILKSGKELPFDVLIWTGGIKANSLTSRLPFQLEKQEKISVGNDLLCLTKKPNLQWADKVYAVGDIVCLYDKNGKPVPAVARAAICQGTIVAKNIIRDIGGQEAIAYRPANYPYIIPIGGKYAIAKIGPLIICGFWGWILKGLVELNYLISIMPARKALRLWLKGLKIFIQNDRLG